MSNGRARREARPASLLAGLIIGISAEIFMVAKYARFLPYFSQYEWVLLIAAPFGCGLLCWLAVWIRTSTRPLG